MTRPSRLIVSIEAEVTIRTEVADFISSTIKAIVATDQEVTLIIRKHVKTSVISITK
jgi:hypothetical protein